MGSGLNQKVDCDRMRSPEVGRRMRLPELLRFSDREDEP